MKLAYDIHTLMAIVEGGDCTDMRDMIHSNRGQSQGPRSQSTSGVGNSTVMPCEYSSEIKELVQSMNTVKADVLNLKQKTVAVETARLSEIKTLKSTVLTLKSDITLLSSTVSKAVTDIRCTVERIVGQVTRCGKFEK